MAEYGIQAIFSTEIGDNERKLHLKKSDAALAVRDANVEDPVLSIVVCVG